jgi:hypothetical protein
VQRIATSCGFGVPLYSFERERSQMPDWAERMGADGLREYQRLKNATSIDGLAAVTWIDAGGEAEAEISSGHAASARPRSSPRVEFDP